MRKIIWLILTLLGCLVIGMLTRGLALQLHIFGAHSLLAAMPLAAFLYYRLAAAKDYPTLLAIMPLLMMSLLLGQMAVVMGFYNLAAILTAVLLHKALAFERAAVIAGSYAFFSYPYCWLGRYLFFPLDAVNYGEIALCSIAALCLAAAGIWLGRQLAAA